MFSDTAHPPCVLLAHNSFKAEKIESGEQDVCRELADIDIAVELVGVEEREIGARRWAVRERENLGVVLRVDRGRVEDKGLCAAQAIPAVPRRDCQWDAAASPRRRKTAHRRKKWNRSVTRRNFFLPWKNAPRAREISGVSEYSEMAANEKSDPSEERFLVR